MKAIVSIFLLGLLCGCVEPRRAQGGMNDNSGSTAFTIKAVTHLWQLLDSTGRIEVISDSSFALIAFKGTDLHNPASGAFRRHNAPKAVFAHATDFDFSVKVEPQFSNRYNGGALLLYADTANWAKILFQWTGEKGIIGMSVVKGGLTDDSYFATSDTASVYLRIKGAGRVFAFYTSSNGVDWNLTRQFVYSRSAALRLGVYAQSPLGPECRVAFSHIRYKEQ